MEAKAETEQYEVYKEKLLKLFQLWNFIKPINGLLKVIMSW